MRPGIALAFALALVVIAAAGVLEWWDGDGRERSRLVSPRGNSSLAEARAFAGFPLYFAGEAAAGYRLAAVQRTDRTSPAPHTEFSFLYGSCRTSGEGGCTLPLEVLLWPACYRYETRYTIPVRERTFVRGVPGRLSREFRRLELYPARTTIVINGGGLEGTAALLGVAQALRGVNARLSLDSPLPPRPPHAGTSIRCRSG